MRRLVLPARLKGLGFRSSAHVCDAAFIGAACRALPQLLDRTVALGGAVPAYCHALASTLRATSFDAANLSTRFAHLVAQRGSLRLAAAFDDAYARLQTEVADPSGAVPDAPLASPVAAAGVILARRVACAKVQHALTTQREKVLVARLETDLDALADARDPRRAS